MIGQEGFQRRQGVQQKITAGGEGKLMTGQAKGEGQNPAEG